MRAFKTWLGRQVGRRDQVGVFARGHRSHIDGLSSLSSLDSLLRDCLADDDTMKARDQAWREYDAAGRP